MRGWHFVFVLFVLVVLGVALIAPNHMIVGKPKSFLYVERTNVCVINMTGVVVEENRLLQQCRAEKNNR